jgi:integrase/recombinase XerD
MARIPPKKMANQIAGLLREQHPDANYLRKVFEYVREDLGVKGVATKPKRKPEIMSEEELNRLYKAVWCASNRMHMVLLKLVLFTGIANEELVKVRLKDVDLGGMRIQINIEKGNKSRQVLFPPSFRDELAEYIRIQRDKGALYLFESSRGAKYSTRWVREIIKRYAEKAGISKRIHPYFFRHQLLSYLKDKGIVDAKVQLLSGLKHRGNLGFYKEISLSDVEYEYRDAMDEFPIK